MIVATQQALSKHVLRGLRAQACQQIGFSLGYRSLSLYKSPPPGSIVFSGIQPTGVPHLGNYLGALQQWVQLQTTCSITTKLYFCIVDLHALTTQPNSRHLQRCKIETLATLLAIGLDPKRCTIFFQSDVQSHTELMWILTCNASMGYLSRMTQWKTKTNVDSMDLISGQKFRAKLKLGLFSYPVLQAADILVHRATHIPVGEDQEQHLEFARECAHGFNAIYGPVLAKPETMLSPTKRVMSLRDPSSKMSKSDPDPRSRILITDTPEEIRRKVKQALTDSRNGISYDPVERPGVSNLLDILSHLDTVGESSLSLAMRFSNLNLGSFKDHVADRIIDCFKGFKDKYRILMQEENLPQLHDVAFAGAKEARANAEMTMNNVRAAVGL